MAYNNQSQGNRFGNKAAAPAGSKPSFAKKVKEALLFTGLFPTNPEKTKAVASVVTEIPVDLKAGQRVYVDLYKNTEEEIAAGKPPYRLRITEAPAMKRA